MGHNKRVNNDAPTINPAVPGSMTTKIAAWSLWDWGSAAWNAVITTFVFTTWLSSTAFVDQTVVAAAQSAKAAGEPANNAAQLAVDSVIATHSSWFGWGVALAGLSIALLAPVLGSRTDAGGRRKLWLGINTGAVVILSLCLFFITPDQDKLDFNVLVGIAILALGNIFFELASVNYNAMLNQISTRSNRGKISGIGWGAGYLGGIVLLLVLFFGFINPEVGWFGVTGENGLDIRISVLIGAAWFGAFAIPVLIAIPEIPAPAKQKPLSILAAYAKLFKDVKTLWRADRRVVRFLISSAIFRDGLAGVFAFGGIIAAGTFGFTASQVVMFAIVANVIAGIATILGGFFEDRVGAKLIIVTALLGMIIAAIVLFFAHSSGQLMFWVFGSILCIFVGPVQSASRSTVSRLALSGHEGELFGLYATTGRAASFLAPAAFALLVNIFGAQYWGILGLALILLVGLILVLPLDLSPREPERVPGQ